MSESRGPCFAVVVLSPPHNGQVAYFDGLIDDVALWSRALSLTDVQALYTGTAPNDASLKADLEIYYPFDSIELVGDIEITPDVDFCRAVAVAALDDPEAVNFVPLTSTERFEALGTGTVDVLIRNTTWTRAARAPSTPTSATTGV